MKKFSYAKKNIVIIFILFAACIFAGCATREESAAVNGASEANGAAASEYAAVGGAALAVEGAATAYSNGAVRDNYTLNELGVMPLVNGKASFSVLVPWPGSIHPEDNLAIRQYSKMTGVDIEWQVVPADGWIERRSIVIASGNLPDYIAATANFGNAVFPATDLLQYGTQGIFLDLMELLPENSIYLKKILEDHPEWEASVLTLDGKLYGVPDINVCYHCQYSLRAWINADWLARLGLDMPSTTNDFKAVLTAFKEQDANGNGNPNDEIPLATSIDGWNTYLHGFLMNAFLYNPVPDQLAVDPDTKRVIFTPTKDAYRDGLRYLNDLYMNGLIAPESFTQDQRTMQQTNESGDATVIGAGFGGTDTTTLGFTVSDRFKEYDVLPPLMGPDGVRLTPTNFSSGISQGYGAITNAAKDPALIMRWLDYMYSEDGTILGDLGREGVNWLPGRPGDIDFRGNPAKYYIIVQQDNNSYEYKWGQTFPSNRSKEYRESMSVDGGTLNWRESPSGDLELRLFQAAQIYEPFAVSRSNILPVLAINPEKITDYTLNKTSINDYVSKSIARFVVGDLSLDSDWDSFQQMLLQMGLADYLSITQEAYEAKMAALESMGLLD